LLVHGLGVTNLVGRTTAAAAELTDDELRAGGERVRALVLEFRPAWLAVLGVTAYRVAFDRRAVVGRQPMAIGSTNVWLLPNPSGRSAAYQLPDLVAAFTELRAAVEAGG
jgi:TDG/mug DNA glycosylase family protein